jgi:hypothetical protein
MTHSTVTDLINDRAKALRERDTYMDLASGYQARLKRAERALREIRRETGEDKIRQIVDGYRKDTYKVKL